MYIYMYIRRPKAKATNLRFQGLSFREKRLKIMFNTSRDHLLI